MSGWRPPVLGQVSNPLEYRTASTPAWFTRALCREIGNPALFYPEVGHLEQARAAKAVCRRCPVRAACLEYALATPSKSDFGVWGGTTHLQRRKIRKQRDENAA